MAVRFPGLTPAAAQPIMLPSDAPLFLTSEELVTLTGYRSPRRQLEWLKKNAIPHRQNGCRHPVVCRAHVLGAATDTTTQPAPTAQWTPAPLRLVGAA